MKKPFLLFLIYSLLLASCEIGEPGKLSFDRETFEKERQLWLEQDLRNYSFHLDFWSNNIQGIKWQGTVTVRDGILSEFVTDPGCRYKLEGLSTEEINQRYPYTYWGWLDSISGIYNNIANDSQEKNESWDQRYVQIRLDVEYDSEFHFPKRYRYYAITQLEYEFIEQGWVGGGSGGRDRVEISNFTRE